MDTRPVKRHTVQKALTLNAVRSLGNHPTADTVYEQIRKEYPNISLGTVYRNLSSLCEDGMLRHIRMPDTADRYDHNLTEHYHIECRRCGKVEDVFIPYNDEIDGYAAENTDYSKLSHDIVFFGLCPDCKERNN